MNESAFMKRVAGQLDNRDARIAELEDEMSDLRADRDGCAYQRDQLRAELAALKAGCGEPVAAVFTMGFGKHYVSGLGPKVDALEVGTKLYAAPAPAVVMPERKPLPEGFLYMPARDEGFNNAIDEVSRLNAVQATEVQS
jgi:hypothetical protein